MQNYQTLIARILGGGHRETTRSGETLSVFGHISRYDLREGFPLVTVKKTLFNSVVKELLWFLRGETNIATLGCGIWNEWADDNGELGPVYGHQWRHWGDQITSLVAGLKDDPQSRRHIVSAWNVTDLPKMALAPCHVLQQANVRGEYLDLAFYQRSADVMLGVPFNIASYALLTHLLAREAGLKPGSLVHMIGNAHIYTNHLAAAQRVLDLEPFPLCELHVAPKPLPYPGCPRDGSVLEPDDFQVVGYQHHPYIKLPVAV